MRYRNFVRFSHQVIPSRHVPKVNNTSPFMAHDGYTRDFAVNQPYPGPSSTIRSRLRERLRAIQPAVQKIGGICLQAS